MTSQPLHGPLTSSGPGTPAPKTPASGIHQPYYGGAIDQEPVATISGKKMDQKEKILEVGLMVQQLMTNFESDNKRLKEQSESNLQAIRTLSTQLERLNQKVDVR